jgi:transcriptional regulator with XRE-family HTH domain
MNGKQLQTILKNRGIKQIWLAEKLNVSNSLITLWVKGEREIMEHHVAEIKHIFNL